MMKIVIASVLFILGSLSTFSQSHSDADAIRELFAQYDAAIVNLDLDFMRSAWPAEYSSLSSSGQDDRKSNLEFLQTEKSKPTFKFISYKTDITNITPVGPAFLVTASWKSESVGSEFPSTIPHQDSGVYSGILQKSEGRWIFIVEHTSEKPHDRNMMLKELAKARQDLTETRSKLDRKANPNQSERAKHILMLERSLAEEYTRVTADGTVLNKAEEVGWYKNSDPPILEVDLSQQTFRITGNTSAVETGIIHLAGGHTDKGKSRVRYRYTTIWVWRDMRWQIVSEQLTALAAQ